MGKSRKTGVWWSRMPENNNKKTSSQFTTKCISPITKNENNPLRPSFPINNSGYYSNYRYFIKFCLFCPASPTIIFIHEIVLWRKKNDVTSQCKQTCRIRVLWACLLIVLDAFIVNSGKYRCFYVWITLFIPNYGVFT